MGQWQGLFVEEQSAINLLWPRDKHTFIVVVVLLNLVQHLLLHTSSTTGSCFCGPRLFI